MTSAVSWSIVDYDGQVGQFAINTVPLTDTNYAAEFTKIVALQGVVDDLIAGLLQKRSINIPAQLLAPNQKATNPDAERGNKWIVNCYDGTLNLGVGVPNPSYLKPFSYEIPTADKTLRTANDNVIYKGDGVASNAPEADAFVAAFEDVAVSPNGGALNVTTIEGVTRSGG